MVHCDPQVRVNHDPVCESGYEKSQSERARDVYGEGSPRETISLQNEETEVEVPLRVPEDVAAVAKVDWRISALHLARTSEGWYLLEMGNVYPI